MAKTLAVVNSSSDTFGTWLQRTNDLVNALSLEIITANSAANGALTSGNGFVNGSFGSNTLIVGTTLQGGTIANAAAFTVSTNASFTDALYTFANTITVGSNAAITINATAITFANGGMSINTAAIGLGNSTVNASIGLATWSISNTISSLSLSASRISTGNSTQNVVITQNNITIGGTGVALQGQTVTVQNNGSNIATKSILNVIPGNNISLGFVNNANNGSVDLTITATLTGNSVVGGSNTFVQINDQGSLSGVNAFTFDKTSNTVSIANTISVNGGNVLLGNNRITNITSTTAGLTAQTIDTFLLANFRHAEYSLSIKDTNASNYMATKIFVVHDGVNAFLEEYGTVVSNNDIGSFSVTSNSTMAIVQFTPTVANTVVNGVRIAVGV